MISNSLFSIVLHSLLLCPLWLFGHRQSHTLIIVPSTPNTDKDGDEDISESDENGEEEPQPKKAPGSKKDKKLLNATGTNWDSQQFSIDNPFKLKIASWNVSGLRAWLEKGGKEYLLHDRPDIMCLQETKCKPDMIPDEAAVKGEGNEELKINFVFNICYLLS